MRNLVLVALVGCGNPAATPDAATPDTPAMVDAQAACSGSACDLICDPADTWFAISRGPGTALGDSEPATPTEIGDDNWHLFLGVNLSTTTTPAVYIFDATASAPDAPFTLPDAPLGTSRDPYDAMGSETPSYLRADEHREYVYYCAIESYAPLSSHLAAYRRVDGGAWTKLGIVAPNANDEMTLCEPNVVRDPATGDLVVQYLTVTTASRVQERQRTSSDPESFAVATSVTTLDDPLDGAFPNRIALSRDPYANVWRTSYDMTTGNYAMQTLQTWSTQPSIVAADLAQALTLHNGAHATHLDLHTDFTGCDTTSCPQGAVLQPSKAIYPNATDVIFYYSGWNTNPPASQLQVNGQRCHRSS